MGTGRQIGGTAAGPATGEAAGPATSSANDGDRQTAPAGSTGVLRAMIRARTPTPAAPLPATLPAAPLPSIERATALAMARAARRTQGLPATIDSITAAGVTLAELMELLPDDALLAIAEGPGERLGVIALCPAMVASLIEMQAVGQVSSRAPTARRPTRTDAAIAAEFVNLLLEELATSLAPLPMGTAVTGFRYASYLDDPRPLGLMLEDSGYHSLRASLRIGPRGERSGQIFVAMPGAHTNAVAALVPAMPARSADGADAVVMPSQQATAVTDAPARADTLASIVQQAPIPLVAILCRKTITLRELRALRPGATLTLPRGVIAEVQLETELGQRLGQGRLGEADGFLALRMAAAGMATASPAGTAEPATGSAGLWAAPGSGGGEFTARSDVLSPFAAAIMPATDVQMMEPPIADLTGPDRFRPDDLADEGATPMPVTKPMSALIS